MDKTHVVALNVISRDLSQLQSLFINTVHCDLWVVADKYNQDNEARPKTGEVSPNIHGLIVELEERPECRLPRDIVNAVATLDVRIVAMVLRCLIHRANVGPATSGAQETRLAIIWRLMLGTALHEITIDAVTFCYLSVI